MTASSDALEQLSGWVAARLGLDFPRPRWRDLERALRPAAGEMGFADFEQYARWLAFAPLRPEQLEGVASRLTVGETYFFREPQAFAALRDHVIPELVARRSGSERRLRVWSAGCCTGEEAYSLAIFLERSCPALQGWEISIVGLDVNPEFVRKAREGVYRSWSFRGAPAWLQSSYFIPHDGDRFELRDEIRRKVTFHQANLADERFPSPAHHPGTVDLIFCRNVLMYFSREQARRVVAGFHRALAEGGHLVVGVCEASSAIAPQFVTRTLDGATFFQKLGCRRRAARASVAIAEVEPVALVPMAVSAAPTTASVSARADLLLPSTRSEEIAALSGRVQAGDTSAVEQLAQALCAGPFDGAAAIILAQALADAGRLSDARGWIERAIAADKLGAPAHHLRATILTELGELDAAAAALENALFIDPDFVLAHVALADLARRAKRRAKSLRHLGQALRVLRGFPPNEVLATAGNLTAARLTATLEAMLDQEVHS